MRELWRWKLRENRIELFAESELTRVIISINRQKAKKIPKSILMVVRSCCVEEC